MKVWQESLEYENVGRNVTRRSPNESIDQSEDQIPRGMDREMIDIDLATRSSSKFESLGFGVVDMDWRKHVKASWAINVRKSGNSSQDETEGLKLSIIKAIEAGWHRIHIKHALANN